VEIALAKTASARSVRRQAKQLTGRIHGRSGNDTAAAGAQAVVVVDRWEVSVLSANDAAAAGARAVVVVDRREDDFLGLSRGGSAGESVH
jgi:hypothetical protein